MSLPAEDTASIRDEFHEFTAGIEARLHECYALLFRIAYGSNKPGDRPLAGGLTLDARKLLARHDIVVAAEEWKIPAKDEDIPEEAPEAIKVADHTHRGAGY